MILPPLTRGWSDPAIVGAIQSGSLLRHEKDGARNFAVQRPGARVARLRALTAPLGGDAGESTVTHKERQERAIRAAVAVADRLGMTSVTPVVVRDSNYTSIHLVPFPVVARVVAPSTLH